MSNGIPNTTNPLLHSTNRLKLGTFCTNTALTLTTVPELWKPTWTNIVAAARLADDAGFEAIVPIARWKGYVDDDPEHPTNEVMEVFTFAAAIAQATRYAAVFATAHAPMFHPLLVAKQAATIDHISGGRFALNVVGGWNRREFDMFGITLREHTDRYAYMGEWLQIIQHLWKSPTEVHWQSENFTMRGAVCRPFPVQRPGPPIMNAGTSRTGMHFSAEHADIAFVVLEGFDPERWKTQVAELKTLARDTYNRSVQVWCNVHIVFGETNVAAQAEHLRFSDTYRDTRAVDGFMTTMMKESLPADPAFAEVLRSRLASGAALPLIGTPETVATELEELSRYGIDGILIGFVDFLDGMPRFISEVLPRLEQAGLRTPRANTGYAVSLE
jgi:alkanesulfonate monooxygenase SsuD/methylene tetrahydromethanopterin reductase-like flavin-dependent oxidoreductase (luciferase family)